MEIFDSCLSYGYTEVLSIQMSISIIWNMVCFWYP